MTPKQLTSIIRRLPAHLPLTRTYEIELAVRRLWGINRIWYSSQKEHWLGWLSEYGGPGAYDRKPDRTRTAEYAYNHINCAPMLFWLAEAVGVPKAKLLEAKASTLRARTRSMHCGILRRAIPWIDVAQRIATAPDVRVLHLNLHREYFEAIANGDKKIEYRHRSEHWRRRLEGCSYDLISFRNGYLKSAPEMLVEFQGVRRYGRGKDAYYAIRLGQVLRIKGQRLRPI
jgi:ASC-1-like (ASCH) protein